jgi:predicted nuclease of predicted toxin-antitoxin system
MNLYLDDDSVDHRLVVLLQRAGHQVVVPADAGLAGTTDPRHLVYAIEHSLVLLTHNHGDFDELHSVVKVSGRTHPGILTVRFDNNSRRDMKLSEIVRAIAKLEGSGVPIAGELHVLNHWR